MDVLMYVVKLKISQNDVIAVRHHSDKRPDKPTPDLELLEINEDSDEEEDSDSDDDDIVYHTAKNRFSYSLGSPLKTDASHGSKKEFLSPDDRPITPMHDQMVYDLKNSSLDFKDGL
jgi:hypothetical protein